MNFFALKWSSLTFADYIKTGALKGDEKPLYYIILHLWRNYVCGSTVCMRYLSVIAGVLSVIMIFICMLVSRDNPKNIPSPKPLIY
jgi:uncharacterized membrane protein